MLLGSSCLCSRRSLLKGAGAAAIVGTASGPLSAVAADTASPRRIDVHHHCYPAEWFKEKRSFILASSDNNPKIMTEWTPKKAVEQLDKYGIETAMLSTGNPGVWFGNVQEGRHLARSCNDYMAQMARDYPGRFGVFMSLPLPDVEGSLREIQYAFDKLHVDGVHLLTSYGDTWPGDAKYAAVFDELNRRKAVVFVHPNVPNCCVNLQPGIAASTGEYPFDEVRAVMSLLYGGTFTRCPDIKFIFTHAGGPVPILAARMNMQLRHPEVAKRLPNGTAPVLRKLYFDVANSTMSKPAMAALNAFTDQSQILFGTDYPYIPMEKTVDGLNQLNYDAAFTSAINRGNAEKLFPRLARA